MSRPACAGAKQQCVLHAGVLGKHTAQGVHAVTIASWRTGHGVARRPIEQGGRTALRRTAVQPHTRIAYWPHQLPRSAVAMPPGGLGRFPSRTAPCRRWDREVEVLNCDPGRPAPSTPLRSQVSGWLRDTHRRIDPGARPERVAVQRYNHVTRGTSLAREKGRSPPSGAAGSS
jgi:hypothetical protein